MTCQVVVYKQRMRELYVESGYIEFIFATMGIRTVIILNIKLCDWPKNYHKHYRTSFHPVTHHES